MPVMINRNMIVGGLIDDYPKAKEVLGAYGVEFIDDDKDLPLFELAELYSIEMDDLIVDIESAMKGED